MKKIFLMVALVATSFAQTLFAQQVSGNESVLLLSYYNVKEALVAGNASQVAAKASEFVKIVSGADQKKLNNSIKKTLVKHMGLIASSKDLENQRNNFSAVSQDLISLVKMVKLSEGPVYQVYCPMKKSSWLSNEKAVKNPYYGDTMLSCGSIIETYK